jgi:hypothetical protein
VTGRIARLSLSALHMAACDAPDDPAVLAHWLYRFGSVPRGPAIDRDFGLDDEPMCALGLTIGGAARRILESAYEASTLQGWYSFARSAEPAQLAAACKLYVSPRPQALPDAFVRIVQVFVQAEVRSFKVGRGVEGLLRSDKIMAYFDERPQMDAVVAKLMRVLSGCPVQGVPFTAEEGGDGLLSSGVDPPLGDTAASWRAWVTARLAAGLVARRGRPPADAVTGTLSDLRSVGVDTARWRSGAGTFRQEAAT